jgi:hypothetical protein
MKKLRITINESSLKTAEELREIGNTSPSPIFAKMFKNKEATNEIFVISFSRIIGLNSIRSWDKTQQVSSEYLFELLEVSFEI